MTQLMNRVSGAAKRLGGKVEKTVGKLVGNPRLQAKGAMLEMSGKAKGSVAKAASRVAGAQKRVVKKTKAAVRRAAR